MSAYTSRVGRPATELDTLSLLNNIPALERNVAKIIAPLNDAGLNWWIHAKGNYVASVARGRRERDDLLHLCLISGWVAAMSHNCILTCKGMLLDRSRRLVLHGRESCPTLAGRPN